MAASAGDGTAPWHPGRASEDTWSRMLDALETYRERHGHCFVSRRHPDPEMRALGRWTGDQRVAANRGELSEERVAKLAAVGFPFDYRAARWEAQFARLKAFRDRYGDCHVPFNDERWGNLATWVQVQRRKRRAGTLDDREVRSLEAIGFAWQLRPGRMSTAQVLRERPSIFLLALESFREAHGHVQVGTTLPSDDRLVQLTSLARRFALSGELCPEAVLLLVEWGVFDDDDTIDARLGFINGLAGFLNSLVEFRRAYGHCRIRTRMGEPFRLLGLAAAIFESSRQSQSFSLQTRMALQFEALEFTFVREHSATIPPEP